MKSYFDFLDSKQISDKSEDLQFYGKDSLSAFKANPSLILFPKSTEEVQKIVNIANQKQIPLVPSGGRTGYSGGATAINSEVVVSLSKMNQILEFNPEHFLIKTEAGVATDKIQEIAAKKDLWLPLDLASSGTSEIGGNIATNAGGGKVLKYGKIGNWLLGLTAVTAAGKIIKLNSQVKKEQLGFDLKKLLIGSEGTLAIITEVTMQLVPKINNHQTLLLAGELKKLEQTFAFLIKQYPQMSSAEFFSHKSLEAVCSYLNLRKPFQEDYSDYCLIEIEDQNNLLDASSIVEEIFDQNLIEDALIASNLQQRKDFWTYRESISEAIRSKCKHKQDISVPVGSVSKFITELSSLLANYSATELYYFGHLGDGNLHLNYASDLTAEAIDQLVFPLILKHQGSLSAEHGIGLLKKEALKMQLGETEIALMKAIKKIFDPNNILNPGKVI